MSSITQIKKSKNYEINTSIKHYLDPDYIYVPIDKDDKINIKNHETVYKGSVILKKENHNYYSSISGEVIGATKITNYKNEELNAIVIENDFKEKSEKSVGAKKYIETYNKEEVIELVTKFNATKRDLKGKILIVNGIDMDPFEENYSYIIKKYADKLLECIDALCEIFKIKKCFLAVKNSDSENVKMLIDNIGTYPSIELKLMPDTYPIGKKEILIKKLTNERSKKLGVMYFNIEEILAIYEVLKKKKPLCEKLITISGDLVEKSKIVNAKIGVLVKDLLEKNVNITKSDYLIVVNGLLNGHEITENCVLTSEIRSIFIMSKNVEVEHDCINCGLCFKNCPVNVNPKYVRENNDKKSAEYAKKCINCGLCTYLCPSKINLSRRLR